MDQAWFEMSDKRRRKLDQAAWIPLRASINISISSTVTYAFEGYKEDYFGLKSLAVPNDKKEYAEKYRREDLGTIDNLGIIGIKKKKLVLSNGKVK